MERGQGGMSDGWREMGERESEGLGVGEVMVDVMGGRVDRMKRKGEC